MSEEDKKESLPQVPIETFLPKLGANEVELKRQNNTTLTFNVGLTEDEEIVDNQRRNVQEQTIIVGGIELYEKRELKKIESEELVTLRHTRRIGSQTYMVKETRDTKNNKTSTDVETNMSEAEVKEFQDQWRHMWHPELSEEEILAQKVMAKKAQKPTKIEPGHDENFETVYQEPEPEVLDAPPAPQAEAKKKKKKCCGCCNIM